MRRYLPSAVAALLVASALAWGQFKGPDVKPRGHTPTSNPLSIVISGAPVNSQIWAWPLAVNLLFPANFVGSPLDGYSGISCGSAPNAGETDTYTFKCTPVGGSIFTMGQVSFGGTSSFSKVQENTGQTNVTAQTLAIATSSNVATGNVLIRVDAIQSNSFTCVYTSVPSLTWNTCDVVNATGLTTHVAWSTAVTGGQTYSVTCTLSPAGTPEAIAGDLIEASGVQTSSNPLDGSCPTGSTGNSTAIVTGNTVTTTNPVDVVIGGGGISNNSTFSGILNSFTTLAGLAGTTANTSVIGGYLQTSSVGTYSTGWTASNATNDFWAGLAVPLKLASTSTSCVPTFTTTGGRPQYCPQGARFEADGSTPLSGSNIGITLPAHTP